MARDMAITILANGDLEITAGPETRADIREGEARDYWSRLADIFEPYSCNGSYTPFEPSDGEDGRAPFVGLTSAPCVAESMDIHDDGTQEIVGRLWWYPNYCLTDPLDDLRDTGRTVFTLAPADESAS